MTPSSVHGIAICCTVFRNEADEIVVSVTESLVGSETSPFPPCNQQQKHQYDQFRTFKDIVRDHYVTCFPERTEVQWQEEAERFWMDDCTFVVPIHFTDDPKLYQKTVGFLYEAIRRGGFDHATNFYQRCTRAFLTSADVKLDRDAWTDSN